MGDIDLTVAHPARVYDYWLGGKDNYAPDRELAEKMAAAVPDIPAMTRANRDFLRRAVEWLVGEQGIRQFLDIGSGIPTANNVHEVAQAIDPTCHVVYVDNDPIVLSHSRALLTSSPEGATAFLAADARAPETIVADPALHATLDLDRPVGLMLLSMLMYFDDATARHILDTVLEALPSGSVLAISHGTVDFLDPAEIAAAASALDTARTSGIAYIPRTKDQVAALFDGTTLLDPGIVPMLTWRPDGPHGDPAKIAYYVGVGRKD